MRIVLVDDHALVRDGIASLVGAWGHEVVGQAATGLEALDLVDRVVPDLVLMDVRLPEVSGIETTRRIKERHPQLPIVMLTASDEEDDLFEAIKAGAQGYLLKDLEATQLRGMLSAVERGEAAITPATARRILAEFQSGGRSEPDVERLTERELDVVRLVTEGLRDKEIADRLGISQNTAKYHLRNVLGKLHAGSRTELAARALREGLIPPGRPRDRAPGA